MCKPVPPSHLLLRPVKLCTQAVGAQDFHRIRFFARSRGDVRIQRSPRQKGGWGQRPGRITLARATSPSTVEAAPEDRSPARSGTR